MHGPAIVTLLESGGHLARRSWLEQTMRQCSVVTLTVAARPLRSLCRRGAVGGARVPGGGRRRGARGVLHQRRAPVRAARDAGPRGAGRRVRGRSARVLQRNARHTKGDQVLSFYILLLLTLL